MSLCHCTRKCVTTEPSAGTLPVIVMVVDVTVGDERKTRADGTVEKISYEKYVGIIPAYPSEQQ